MSEINFKESFRGLAWKLLIIFLVLLIFYGTGLHRIEFPTYTDEQLLELRLKRLNNQLLTIDVGSVVGLPVTEETQTYTWLIVSENNTERKTLLVHAPLDVKKEHGFEVSYDQAISYGLNGHEIQIIKPHFREDIQEKLQQVFEDYFYAL
ncbi:hypothetical protein KC865_03670 [Candidatus Kaiserbacteria bacterium]|nr:hypothetical protein [Candidatus Kaiserbacteria bacterium]USN91955.1 MAG: hypothetical protein H6782_03710 [Candidatus Nomurabacteria bacterium]